MDNISLNLENISFWTFLAVYIGGVITSVTPCVYPLVPIIAAVIGSGRERSKLKNFLLSVSYVIGMAVTFAVLGMVAALTGRLFGQIQSSPVAHIVLGAVIILFALALLDVVHLPVFFLTRLGAGKVIKGNSLLSIFFMGAVSGLVAAPCTTAIIGALLAYIASTQNVVIGFSFLFVFALGLGTFLILVGTFSGILAAMPSSPKWVKLIEKAMGVAMIVLGCYFIFKAGQLAI